MAPTPGRFMCGTTAFHKLAASATRELARAFCHSRVGCKVQQSSATAAACRWRQAQEGQRAAFKEGVIWIDDILEGVALEPPWCKACVAMLPAGIQCSLRTEHTVEFPMKTEGFIERVLSCHACAG